jgi:hypothetical protein
MSQSALYLLCCCAPALYFVFVQLIVERVALNNSSKVLAEKLAPLIQPADQLVIYHNFCSSLPYYLNIERPVWVVSSKKDHSIMESYYVAEKHLQPPAAYGKALFNDEEFSELWKTSKKRLLVVIQEKNLRHLVGKNQQLPEIKLRSGEFVLVTNL